MHLPHRTITLRIMLHRKNALAGPAHAPRPEGTIRKLHPGETAALAEHLLRLAPDSRHDRFTGGVSDDFVADYARRALRPDSVVHGWFVDGTLRAAAELHPYGACSPALAEAAFSVEGPFQNSGIGTELMGRTILAARNRGIRLLVVRCVVDNKRMQAIAKKYGAELRFELGDVVGELANPLPTPLSYARELIADGHGFVGSVLDLQSHLLRSA
jgi:RimJ/RimL family protein N-acetyltransferase